MIRAERERAHAKHGSKSMEGWPPEHPSRLPILMEEVGEVAREMNEAALANRYIDHQAMRAELIQVAAMAAAWADVLTIQQPCGTGAPIYQWAQGHECRDCDGPDRPCDTCLDDLADSEAERWADVRRDER